MNDERPIPPPADRRRRGRDGFRLLWGVLLIGVGLWFFAERTLRIDLPAIPWNDLWPVLLIGLGAWIVLRGATRRST